jgi:hypothetical protein
MSRGVKCSFGSLSAKINNAQEECDEPMGAGHADTMIALET